MRLVRTKRCIHDWRARKTLPFPTHVSRNFSRELFLEVMIHQAETAKATTAQSDARTSGIDSSSSRLGVIVLVTTVHMEIRVSTVVADEITVARVVQIVVLIVRVV